MVMDPDKDRENQSSPVRMLQPEGEALDKDLCLRKPREAYGRPDEGHAADIDAISVFCGALPHIHLHDEVKPCHDTGTYRPYQRRTAVPKGLERSMASCVVKRVVRSLTR